MSDKQKNMPAQQKLEVAKKLLTLLEAEIPEEEYHFGEQVEVLALAYATITSADNLLHSSRR